MPPEGRFSTCFSSKPALIMRKVSSRSFLPDFMADFISSEILSSSAIVLRSSEAPEDGDARSVDGPAFLGTEQQHQLGDFLRRHPLGADGACRRLGLIRRATILPECAPKDPNPAGRAPRSPFSHPSPPPIENLTARAFDFQRVLQGGVERNHFSRLVFLPWHRSQRSWAPPP